MIISFILFVLFGVVSMPNQALAASTDCVVPFDNMQVSTDTTLCSGTYSLPDLGKDGVLHIKANNVTLNCNGATIVGTGGEEAGHGIVSQGSSEGWDGVTVRNCNIENYGTGIIIANTSHALIENNIINVVGRAKGLQLGNLDRAIDTITVRNNTFTGEGNGLSFGSSNPAINVYIENNRFSVSIDSVVLSGGPDKNSFFLSGNHYDNAMGEIIGLHDSDNTVIQNEVIHDTTYSNFLIRQSHNVTVKRNRLAKAGFQIEGSLNGLYDGNQTGRGINITQASNQNIFINNVVSTTENWTVRVSDSSNNTFTNNTFYGGRNQSVFLEGPSTNNAFRNTIIYTREGITPMFHVLPEATSGFMSDYNDLYSPTGFTAIFGTTTVTSLSEWQQLTGGDQHSMSKDPKFRNISREDFHLRFLSPAIDAGDPLTSGVSYDYESDTRPQGVGYDLGADERGLVSTRGVRLTGQIEYNPDDGFAAVITVVDPLNPETIQYAITPDNKTTWIQSNGTLGSNPYFSTSRNWRHVHIPVATTNVYRFVVSDEGEQSRLSNCGLVLTTSAGNGIAPWSERPNYDILSLLSLRSVTAVHASCPSLNQDATTPNEYQCSTEAI